MKRNIYTGDEEFKYEFVDSFQDSRDIMIFGGDFTYNLPDYKIFGDYEITGTWFNDWKPHMVKTIHLLIDLLFRLRGNNYRHYIRFDTDFAYSKFISKINSSHKNAILEDIKLFKTCLKVNNILTSFSSINDKDRMVDLFNDVCKNLNCFEREIIEMQIVLKIHLGRKLLAYFIKNNEFIVIDFNRWPIAENLNDLNLHLDW